MQKSVRWKQNMKFSNLKINICWITKTYYSKIQNTYRSSVLMLNWVLPSKKYYPTDLQQFFISNSEKKLFIACSYTKLLKQKYLKMCLLAQRKNLFWDWIRNWFLILKPYFLFILISKWTFHCIKTTEKFSNLITLCRIHYIWLKLL